MLTRSGITTALILLGVIICIAQAQAQMDITVSGGWVTSIGTGDLSAGAGSDLIAAHASEPDEVALTITGTAGAPWRVDIRRDSGVWQENLSLFARRTGDGTGSELPAGGLSYTPIDTIGTQFFSGTGDRSNIPIQLKLDGVSLQVPPNIYSTTITYTLVEI